jgi:SnoaL-like domain
MSITETQIQELWDQKEIEKLMLRFGRGLDTNDMDLYASCFTDPFTVDFSDLTGLPPAQTTPELWADFARLALGQLLVMHQYSNFNIAVTGDEAVGVIYHVSRHRLPNLKGADQYTQYGYYENDFLRTTEGWKIQYLRHNIKWCDGNPSLIDMSDPALQASVVKVFGG